MEILWTYGEFFFTVNRGGCHCQVEMKDITVDRVSKSLMVNFVARLL
jgi:hypothetical protein